MILKNDSVEVAGITPELLLGLYVADQVYAMHGVNMYVTSCTERGPRHAATSSHWRGMAADIRISNLQVIGVEPEIVSTEIQQRLNKHYQVILEDNHIHIQYRPTHG